MLSVYCMLLLVVFSLHWLQCFGVIHEPCPLRFTKTLYVNEADKTKYKKFDVPRFQKIKGLCRYKYGTNPFPFFTYVSSPGFGKHFQWHGWFRHDGRNYRLEPNEVSERPTYCHSKFVINFIDGVDHIVCPVIRLGP